MEIKDDIEKNDKEPYIETNLFDKLKLSETRNMVESKILNHKLKIVEIKRM